MNLFAFSPLTGQRVSRDARWTAATIGFLASLTCGNCLRIVLGVVRAGYPQALVLLPAAVVPVAAVIGLMVRRYRTFRRWQPGEWTVRLVHPGRRTARVRAELRASLATDRLRARAAVRRSPIVLAQGVDEVEARALAARLTSVGADVRLVGPRSAAPGGVSEELVPVGAQGQVGAQVDVERADEVAPG